MISDFLYLTVMKKSLLTYFHDSIIGKITSGGNDSLQIAGFKYAQMSVFGTIKLSMMSLKCANNRRVYRFV